MNQQKSLNNNTTTKERSSPFVVVFLCFFLLLTACNNNSNIYQDDLALADQAFEKNDISDAEMYYERFLRKNPTSENRWWAWNRLLAIALNIRQQKNSATNYMEIMLEEYKNDADRRRSIQLSLATLYSELRNQDRAILLWENLITDSTTPDEVKAEVYRNLAHAYLGRLNFADTKISLETCLTLNVKEEMKGDCLFDLAEAQILIGELQDAEQNLQKLLDIPAGKGQRDLLTKFMLADVLEQQEKHEEAIALFTEIKSRHPNRLVVDMRIENLKKIIKKRK